MNKAAILALLFAVGFYVIGTWLCNFEIVAFNIFGIHIGYKPFASFSTFVLPIAALGAIFIYFLTRKGKAEG